MGLDIHVYTNTKLVQEETPDMDSIWEWADEQEGLHGVGVFCNPHFLKQRDGLVDGWYDYESSKGVLSRSYSGWSAVRNELALAAGYKEAEITEEMDEYWKATTKNYPYQSQVYTKDEGVLNELIKFSDCEGTINYKCCCKIYHDLTTHVDTSLLSEFGLPAYNKLVEGFRTAAENNGFVTFG